MPYIPQHSIQGIQEVQQRNLRRIAALTPAGAAGAAVRDALISLHRYAVSITHVGMYERGGNMVGGGSLRASHRIDYAGLEGKVYIDRAAKNPITGQKPSVYGVYENARGGEHAFYDRTVAEQGPKESTRAAAVIKDAMIYAK